MSTTPAAPVPAKPAHLVDACEPLFQAVCRLNRMARKGTSLDYPTVRAELEGLFEKMRASVAGDVALSEQYRKVELGLMFFVDSMISESTLPFAGEWNRNRLGYGRNELAGDEKFFDLVDETLKENREGADERLAVYYTCLGLGFTGWYAGNPEYLRKKMLEIAPRVKAWVDTDDSGLLTPDTYSHTNLADLPLPVGSSLAPVLIVLGGLLLLVGAVNFYAFRSAAAELNRALDTIVANDPAEAGK